MQLVKDLVEHAVSAEVHSERGGRALLRQVQATENVDK